MYKLNTQEFSYNKISYNNNNIIITISQHIENAGTVSTVYSDIFTHIQGHSAISIHVQAY